MSFDIVLPEGVTLPEGANPKRFGWKFLRRGRAEPPTTWVSENARGKLIKSQNGPCDISNCWTIGEWKSVKGEIVLCRNGFHCSPSIWCSERVRQWRGSRTGRVRPDPSPQ